jgi:hypothetical protein
MYKTQAIHPHAQHVCIKYTIYHMFPLYYAVRRLRKSARKQNGRYQSAVFRLKSEMYIVINKCRVKTVTDP